MLTKGRGHRRYTKLDRRRFGMHPCHTKGEGRNKGSLGMDRVYIASTTVLDCNGAWCHSKRPVYRQTRLVWTSRLNRCAGDVATRKSLRHHIYQGYQRTKAKTSLQPEACTYHQTPQWQYKTRTLYIERPSLALILLYFMTPVHNLGCMNVVKSCMGPPRKNKSTINDYRKDPGP
jgi:hypothetical protein